MKDEISALIDDELDQMEEEVTPDVVEELKNREQEANNWAQKKAEFEKAKEEYQKSLEETKETENHTSSID